MKRRRRKPPPLPHGVRWKLFRRRLRRLFHAPSHRRPVGQPVEAPVARRTTETRDAQGIVDAAKERAKNIEQQAVDWAERLIAAAQQRASEIVAEAEERVEEVASRSSQLTVDYLQEVFSLLRAGAPIRQPQGETETEQEARLEVAPVREGPWERAPEGTVRPNLGIVPKAGEGA